MQEGGRERGFTAAPAGRLRLGGGGCCFLRRRSGGGLVAPPWPPAAGNPSAGSGRGMLGRAVAFPEEGDDVGGGPAAEWSGRGGGFAGLKMDAAAGLDPPPPHFHSSHSLASLATYVLAGPVPCRACRVLSAPCCVNMPPGIDGYTSLAA